jgi:hypothetical protein
MDCSLLYSLTQGVLMDGILAEAAAWERPKYFDDKAFTERAKALLRAMLPRFTVEGHVLLPERYEIKTRLEAGQPSHFYFEGRIGFVLCHDGIGVASVGFNVRPELTIVQLQGVKGKRTHLAPLRWERLLVELVAALMDGHERVHLMPAEEICWYARPFYPNGISERELIRHQRRLYRRYNGTAEALGFCYLPELKLWARAREIA